MWHCGRFHSLRNSNVIGNLWLSKSLYSTKQFKSNRNHHYYLIKTHVWRSDVCNAWRVVCCALCSRRCESALTLASFHLRNRLSHSCDVIVSTSRVTCVLVSSSDDHFFKRSRRYSTRITGEDLYHTNILDQNQSRIWNCDFGYSYPTAG